MSVTGSWFPTGFYGHSRGRNRNDIRQEYRKEAQPHPPQTFVKRMKEYRGNHIFSQHDNRQIFPSSVLNFGNGQGKRKPLKTGVSYNFTHWAPVEEELKRHMPHISTYQSDFWGKEEIMPMNFPQLLVSRVRQLTSASCSGRTTCRHMLRSEQPKQSFSKDKVNNQDPQETTVKDISHLLNNAGPGAAKTGFQRAWSAPYQRMTVSDCLIWPTPEVIKQDSFQQPIQTS
ncbi:hypothetical protein FKM82_004488 [Ascaphus truei]